MPLGVERDHLLRSERVQAIGAAGFIAELDLESVLGKNLNDSADLTSDKAQLRQVADESNGIEKMDERSGRHIELSTG